MTGLVPPVARHDTPAGHSAASFSVNLLSRGMLLLDFADASLRRGVLWASLSLEYVMGLASFGLDIGIFCGFLCSVRENYC